MKKLFIGLCLALCGCGQKNPPPYYLPMSVQNEPPPQEQPQTEPMQEVPAPTEKASPRMIKNEKCEDLPAIQIFNVTNSFSLAHACKATKESKELYCYGHIIYIAREEGRLHYNGQNIKPNKGKCFSYNGTYQYIDHDGGKSFIPKVEIVDSMIEEPDWNSYLLERTKR